MSIPSFEYYEADGTLVVVFPAVDSVNVFHGNKTIDSVSMSPRAAVRLGWFLIWRYWVCWLYCGLRPKLHERALRKGLTAQARRLRGLRG